MPIFYGCEGEGSAEAIKLCTDQKIYDFISENIRYPEMMRYAGIYGKIHISFVINENGAVEKVKILKGIKKGKLLDEEAIRVINILPKMKPGKQRGKPVKVQYTLPIKFSL